MKMETGVLNSYGMRPVYNQEKSIDNLYSESTDDSACNSTYISTSPDGQERTYSKMRTSTLCDDGQSVEEYTQVQNDKWNQSDISSVKEDSDSEFSDDYKDYEEVHSDDMDDPDFATLKHNLTPEDEVCFENLGSSVQIITVNPDSSYESDASIMSNISNISSESSTLTNQRHLKSIQSETCPGNDIIESLDPKSVLNKIRNKLCRKNMRRKQKKSPGSKSNESPMNACKAKEFILDARNSPLDLDNYISDLNNLHIKNNDVSDEHDFPPHLLKNIEIKSPNEENLKVVPNDLHKKTHNIFDSIFTHDDMELECPIESKIDESCSSLVEENNVVLPEINQVKQKSERSLLDYCLEKERDETNHDGQIKRKIYSTLPSSLRLTDGPSNELEKDSVISTFGKIKLDYDIDEFVDIESFTDSDSVPVLEANNLNSLLEQFEKTEKLNLLDCFDNSDEQLDCDVNSYFINGSALSLTENEQKYETNKEHLFPITDDTSPLSTVKIQRLMSPAATSDLHDNLNSSSESIQLDHNYCSPSKMNHASSPLKLKLRKHSQSDEVTDFETDLSVSSTCNLPSLEDKFLSPIRPDLLKNVVPYYKMQNEQIGLGKGKCISNAKVEVSNDAEKNSEEQGNANTSCLINKSNHRKKDCVVITSPSSTSSDHCYTKQGLNSFFSGNAESFSTNNISNGCDIMFKKNNGAKNIEVSVNNSVNKQVVNTSITHRSISQFDRVIAPKNAKSLLKTSLLLPIKLETALQNGFCASDNEATKCTVINNFTSTPMKNSIVKSSPRKGNQVSLLKSSYTNDHQILDVISSTSTPQMEVKLKKPAVNEHVGGSVKANGLPQKRKLNLQEYKLRREGKSNESSRTSSPITTVTIENSEIIKTEIANTINLDPGFRIAGVLKNVPSERDTSKDLRSAENSNKSELSIKNDKQFHLGNVNTREATRLILKKRRVAALRKTEDKIVLSKIPKVNTVEILPLTLEKTSCHFNADAEEALEKKLTFKLISEFEEIVMVSIGVNTESVEVIEFPQSCFTSNDTIEDNKNFGTVKSNKTPVNFKIMKKKVLNRNPLFEVNSDSEDNFIIDKLTKNSKSIQTKQHPYCNEQSTGENNVTPKLTNCAKPNLDMKAVENSNIPNIKMEINEPTTNKIFGGFNFSAILENINECKEHGEDKVIMHLKKDREKPKQVSVEVQAVDDKLFLPLSTLCTYLQNPSDLKSKTEIMDITDGCKNEFYDTQNEQLQPADDNELIKETLRVKHCNTSDNDSRLSTSHSDESKRVKDKRLRDRSSSIEHPRGSHRYRRRSRYRSPEKFRSYRRHSRDRSSGSPPNKIHRPHGRSRGNVIMPNRNCRRSEYRQSTNDRCRSRSYSSESMMESTSSRISYSSSRSNKTRRASRNRNTKPRSRSISSSSSSEASSTSNDVSQRSSLSRSNSAGSSRRSYRRRSRGRYQSNNRRPRSREQRYRIKDHRSPSRSKSPYDNRDDSDVERPVEERRIVFVGRLEKDITKLTLRRVFDQFGPIKEVTLHSKEDGSRYGFLTFAHANDAWVAVGEAHRVPAVAKYDVSFGGRRAFCRKKYADLDNIEMDYEDDNMMDRFPMMPVHSDELSFDRLLSEMKRTLTRRKVNGDRGRRSD